MSNAVLDEMPVAAVNAVEIADRRHGARQARGHRLAIAADVTNGDGLRG